MTDQDVDQMDVDHTTPETIPASSSFEKVDPAELHLDELNKKMQYRCYTEMWQARMEQAEGDPSLWQPLISNIFLSLVIALAATGAKNRFIAPTLDAVDIVTGFNEAELEHWKVGVQKGVKTNDWTSLIMHTKLRKRKVPNVALGVPIEYKDAVIHAWSFKYHGNAHTVLLKAIDNLHVLPIRQTYAKIFPIAQSSGMGKSKTVDKVATERILFPICLREDIGKNYFAYPPTDEVVRNHLDFAPSTKDERGCKQYLKSFLSSLFASARVKAQELFPGSRKVSYTRMAIAFYDFFANPSDRMDFYESVVTNAQNSPYQNVWESFTQLKNYLEEHCSTWPAATLCPILVSLDEVHVLYTHRRADSGSDYTLYSRLRSVLNEGVPCDFAFISLSTASHVSSLAPSKDRVPSMREKDNELILPVPFTELPFDVYVTAEPLAPDQATLTSVGSLEFTAKFGRPLFYASYLSRKDGCGTHIASGIMSNVRAKLYGRPWPPEAPAELDESSIAVLSARLLLDLSPATANAKRYEEELVRNHLRILYSVHQNRQTIVTGSSPEPLIAEASAQIMYHTLENNKPYMDLWSLLEQFVNHGFAAQGAIGELIGRALSISAMDHAIHGLSTVRELTYQTPVTVADYYRAFLTDKAWDALSKSVPTNRARLSYDSANKTFKDAFQDAYFHFSHYGKANDCSPMRDTCAWAHWLRGTAVACQANQELTDRMTPIYFSSLGNVSPKTISVNLDQDKMGQSVNPLNVAIQSAEDLSIFSHGNKLPYITAAHCYALTENQGITVTQPSSHDLQTQKKDEEAPRYQIDFRGLSAYGNITDPVRTAIRTMIDHSKNAVFNDHCRDYGVPMLQRMQPVLTESPASTEWFGGSAKADAWNARAAYQKDSTAGPSTAGLAR